MNYFIDFEATQFSNGIISVGCVAENGAAFYTIVNTKHKVTPFITDLTGITPEAVDAAPSQERVFENMFDWVFNENTVPHFYCYGNCDKDFVKNNFRDCKSFKAKAMLGYLYTDLQDYSTEVKMHFGLCKNISLKKVADYYRGKEEDQRHNSLEDAQMLKFVWENIQKNECEFDVFPEYMEQQFNKKIEAEAPSISEKSYTVCRMKNGKVIEYYPSLGAAIKWAYEQIPAGEERDKTSLKTIARGIKRAAKDPKKKYRNFKWTMTEKN